MSSSARVSCSLPCIPCKQLTLSTNNWSPRNVIGYGGFSTVYKGIWNETKVAVKRMKIDELEGDNDEPSVSNYGPLRQLLNEISILGSVSHENIIRLLGFGIDSKMSCLVYALMNNGSLQDRLLVNSNRRKPLDWSQRRDIARGLARGLHYLHTAARDYPVIHGDIKSANVLLDRNFVPKISDFGLSRLANARKLVKVSRPRGTQPYMPNEYIYGNNLSTKVDSYAYGIVLFELATGLLAYDKSRPVNKLLRDLVWSNIEYRLSSLKDTQAGDDNHEVFDVLINVGQCCTNKIETLRPDMNLVLEQFNHYDLLDKSDEMFGEAEDNVFAVLNQIDF